MYKILILLSLAATITVNLQAQVPVTVNVPTAGGFSAALSAAGGNKATVTNLTVIGNIDARDVKFMRDSMPVLAVLDMEAVQIISYSGTEGTVTGSTSYPTNTMPQESFKSSKIVAGVQGNGTLKTIVLPAGLTVIGNSAFFQCQGLIGILTIPNSVTTIESQAFCACSHITGLIIPGSVSSIGYGAFEGCWKLSGKLLLPENLKTLGAKAFDGCAFTGTLKIPNSINNIQKWTFQSCNFTNIIFPDNLKSIEYDAFGWCDSLKGEIILPNAITTISDGFRFCIGITVFYLPNSIVSIQSTSKFYGTFSGCTSLKIFFINKNSPLKIDTTVFEGVNTNTCELIVPVGSKADYEAATGWMDFTIITEAIFITLNTQGGNPAFPITTTLTNSTIAEPSNPVRDGFIFTGWYKEAACTNIWNFATDIVTAPITLYAKWSIVSSIKTITDKTNLKIYPQPASDYIIIEGANFKHVTIIDLLGNKLHASYKVNDNNARVDISNLKPGAYIIKAEMGNRKTQGIKFIKK